MEERGGKYLFVDMVDIEVGRVSYVYAGFVGVTKGLDVGRQQRRVQLCRMVSREARRRLTDTRLVLRSLKEARAQSKGYAVVDEESEELVLEQINREIRKGNYRLAERMLLYALKKDCKREKLFLRLALLEQKRDDPEFARRVFEYGVCSNPSSSSLLQAWGLFESKRGNTFRAVQLLLRSVSLNPRNAPVLRWKRWKDEMYSGALTASSPTLSRRQLRSCLMLSPQFVPAWISLSMLEFSQGSSADVVRNILLQGLRNCGADSSLLTVWGLVETRLGNHSDATQLFRARDRLSTLSEPSTTFSNVSKLIVES